LSAIFAAADQDGNGTVEFGEFLATIAHRADANATGKSTVVTEQELAEVFKVFDKVSPKALPNSRKLM